MKVGLCLGGGGGKGAYQIGAYKALREFNQTKKIKAISGTSIGALNITLLGVDKLEKAIETWYKLPKANIIKVRNPLNFLNPKVESSVLTTKPIIDVFEENIDFDELSKAKRKLFVGITNVTKDIGEIRSLNGLDKDSILKYILASSAIPVAFPKIVENENKYIDGYKYLNVPIDCLIENGCNFIFAIPLSPFLAPNKDSYPNTTIIDINYKGFENTNLITGTLNFKEESIKERMELGYVNMKKMLTYLQKINIIQVNFKDKIRYFFRKLFGKTKHDKKYFNLDDIE